MESKIACLSKSMKSFKLYVHPYVHSYISSGIISLKRKWQSRYGWRIRILPDQNLAFLAYRFTGADGAELDMKEEQEII